jgi:D-sedoheptulose 7-phosphate isomerase
MGDTLSDPKLDPRSKNAMFTAQSWKGYVRQYAHDLEGALEHVSESALDGAYRAITTAVSENRRIFVAGNGGSAAIADHLCCDWTKGTHSAELPPLRTHSLVSNVALLTAVANDFGYDDVFARQLEMLGSAGDVILLISSSGNSPNVVAAADTAKRMGITTVGLTGFSGGALAKRVDFSLHVPYANYGLVEDGHQILMHTFAQLFVREREIATPQG